VLEDGAGEGPGLGDDDNRARCEPRGPDEAQIVAQTPDHCGRECRQREGLAKAALDLGEVAEGEGARLEAVRAHGWRDLVGEIERSAVHCDCGLA
jgi:hypothetical protein